MDMEISGNSQICYRWMSHVLSSIRQKFAIYEGWRYVTSSCVVNPPHMFPDVLSPPTSYLIASIHALQAPNAPRTQ